MNHGAVLRARARRLGGLMRYVARRYKSDGASRMAASLSYTSLLSLVPLMAIALAMLAAFPVFDGIRGQLTSWVFANFVPAVGEAVQTQVARFIANAGKLTAAGIVGLAFTAIMLLVTIEGAFNAVFRVARARSVMSKLLVYWTVLTLGPLLIGASLSLHGYFTAMAKLQIGSSTSALLATPLPTVLAIAAFTVLFAAIPNRQVRIKDALAGAVVAGVLFAVLRWGFTVYVTSSGAYASLYGAVAVVPIFLLWMFLSWAVVLMGAEVTAALPEWRAGYHEAGTRASGARRLTLALEVLALLLAAARDGRPGLGRRDLLAACAVPERDLQAVLRRLTTTGFVAPTSGKSHLLARDLDSVTLHDLAAALDLDLALDDAVATTARWRPKAETLIGDARRAATEALAMPLKEVLAVDELNGSAPSVTSS
ncbi:YihY family inner membrane protein [Magnetospirillum sp. UT-4]|uniref:YihY family inner membrane protein n=1 Tax=Magnetospirillum sp. UT-4 TaxID=2681467 RepID=UPI00137D6F7E|nr:YihY family inner membrane protein [Magnetospirillum sp. UT-4]CAA7627130.1 conserved membrane hypothetical protein [Magnetospirillum sp. UT-4]